MKNEKLKKTFFSKTMMETRKAYLLTGEEDTPRKKFSVELLKIIGFEVVVVHYWKDADPVLSNKRSMLSIYERIKNSQDAYSYVFEDDINLLEPIALPEIIKYEQFLFGVIYLGCCIPHYQTKSNYRIFENKLDGKEITVVSGANRGLHAIGLSRQTAYELWKYAKNSPRQPYMDMILEEFTLINPALVCRYDLESKRKGHRGIFFQDRCQFPSTIS
jgi:hypothetical protein